jgi:hypothetical protein
MVPAGMEDQIMRCKKWVAVLGLSFVSALPVRAEITKGVMGIIGAQMP